MHTIKINNTAYSLPSKWDNLTKRQLFSIINRFTPGIPINHFKLKVLLSLLQLKVKKQSSFHVGADELFLLQRKGKTPFLISPDQLITLSDRLSWLLSNTKDSNNALSLNSELTVNLIPSFKHRFVRYYGPSNRLYNLVFEEYLEAENHYHNFLKTNEPEYIDKLVSTLYRRKSATNTDLLGDQREAFNMHMVEAHALKIKRLDPTVKLAIFLFFQGCRHFLSINFPHVFTPAAKSASKAKSFGSLSLIDALTGDDVTKNKLVRTSFLYDVMVRLERASIQSEEMKDKLKIK